MKIFRKIPIKERLPENGKSVITVDTNGNSIVYRRFSGHWNMSQMENNHPLEYWLEECELEFPSGEQINEVGKNSPNDDRWKGFKLGANWVIDFIKEKMNYE